jgi:hypothetical protein
VPDQGLLGGWEPVFHAAVSGEVIYVPGFGGDDLEARPWRWHRARAHQSVHDARCRSGSAV